MGVTTTGALPLEKSISDVTSPQLGGNLSLNNNGIIIESQTIEGTVVSGDLCFYDGINWKKSNGTSESTSSGMLGVFLGSGQIMTYGVWTTSGLVAGDIYFASTAAGEITNTKPSTTGNIVRVVGYSLSSTQLMLIPDNTFVEIA